MEAELKQVALMIKRHRRNRFFARFFLLIGFVMLITAGIILMRAEEVKSALNAIYLAVGTFFPFILCFIFHNRSRKCPVCNRRLGNEENYDNKEIPVPEFLENIPQCPFCNAVIE